MQICNKQYKFCEWVLKILGFDCVWMMKFVKVMKDGQEMWEGVLFDYIVNRENLWVLVEMFCEKMEQVGL